MAQIINSIINTGLFKADKAEFTEVTENTFSVDMTGCKDPVTVIAEVPAGEEVSFACIGCGDGKTAEIPLAAGSVNVFRITTKGYKNEEGFAEFQILSSGAPKADSGVKVAFLKQVSVINH